jgi:hypothetical protein
MGAAGLSETLVPIYQITQRRSLETTILIFTALSIRRLILQFTFILTAKTSGLQSYTTAAKQQIYT